jgi:uncharacterized protein YqjF (DUF2071 family)
MHRGAKVGVVETKYRPVAAAFEPQPGTLEHFLTERYCLYAADSAGKISRGEIHHPPWQLQVAEAEFTSNTMVSATGLPQTAEKPLLHFSRRQDVVVWQPEAVAQS